MISIPVKHGGELSARILASTRSKVRASARVLQSSRVTKWRQNEEKFIGYIPEKDVDRLRRQKREGGTPDYTTIQLPYTYAVAMAAHSFFCSVYLSKHPIFQFMGNTGEGEQQVLAVEALHNYQVLNARMRANLYVYFQDAPKYGEAWIMPYWREERVRVSSIEEVEDSFLGVISLGKKKKRVTREILGYQGNSLLNVHPSKIYTDPRFSRNRFQEGEFVAIETTLSRNQLLAGAETGQYININRIGKRGTAGLDASETVFEQSNAEDLQIPNVDEYTSHEDKHASDVHRVYEVYVDLIPSSWNLGKSSLPEKWVFTVDQDFTVVLECRPLGNYHNKFPLAMIELEPEAYNNFSRGVPEIFSPIQNTLDWLVNSHFWNVRQVLNNQWVLDPSRIQERDLTQNTPGKAIRLKPAAYGSDVRTALNQLPVQDVTRTHLNDMAMMYDMGERLGISDQVMGMAAPSSRRTAQEIRGDQTFGISRLKTMAEYFSATGFSDLGTMLLKNSQQFYNGTMKLRIAGEAASLAGETFINVTPEEIVGQYSLEPVDGTLPVDRFAQANLWRTIITEMAAVPQVVQEYDLGKIFGYVAQLSGIKNLNRFKIQIVGDDAIATAAQAGNSIPTTGGTNILEPGQVQGMGPTA